MMFGILRTVVVAAMIGSFMFFSRNFGDWYHDNNDYGQMAIMSVVFTFFYYIAIYLSKIIFRIFNISIK